MNDIKHPTEFARRPCVPEAWRKLAIYLADCFLSQRDATDPHGGSETEDRKDLEAFLAINGMKDYFGLVDWALDHQVGMALEGLKFVPLQPSGTREDPEYLEKRSEVDNHKHEIAGAQFDGLKYSIGDPPATRRSSDRF